MPASPMISNRGGTGGMRGGGPSPPISNNQNQHRVPSHMMTGVHRTGRSSVDDDLSHPLAGEHIDDPSMVMAHGNGGGNHGSMIHHQSHQGGYPASYSGRGGPGTPHHHLINSSQQNPGSTSLEQMAAAGMVPSHFAAMEPAQQQQLTAGAGGTASPGPRVVYNVKFKRTQRSFILGQRVPRDIKIGCYVKVEADRGEDLGIVVSRMPAEKFNATGRSNFRLGIGAPGVSVSSSGEVASGVAGPPAVLPGAGGAADLKRVIRLATHDEVSLLAVKREEEDELLKICKGKVRQRGLPMNVVDAEYQFDRHKLTFFFEAEGRIDFRELVRDLFSIYKTRIWMQQLDKNGGGGSGLTPISGSSSSIAGGSSADGTVDNEFDGSCGSASTASRDNERE